jgi:hypothetical protein
MYENPFLVDDNARRDARQTASRYSAARLILTVATDEKN